MQPRNSGVAAVDVAERVGPASDDPQPYTEMRRLIVHDDDGGGEERWL